MGNDTDPEFHFGAGLKYALTHALGLRLDVRDTLSQKANADDGDLTHFPEVTLGLAVWSTPREKQQVVAAAPVDSDADGFSDDRDKYPQQAGISPDGCPGQGHRRRRCPRLQGRLSRGGRQDRVRLPGQGHGRRRLAGRAGQVPERRPARSTAAPISTRTRTASTRRTTSAPTRPEIKNGFEDTDGCPDEIPEKIKKFTGVIAGIEFDRGKDTIRPVSEGVLTNALAILQEYPQLKIEISGHTDTDGKPEDNVDLSKRRADSVKAWFVGKGIDESRITTRGAGPNEPIADNKTATGKPKNRRIEFKLTQ